MKALAKNHDVFLVSLLQEDSKREDAGKLDDICEVVSLHESRWFKPYTLKSFLGYFSNRPRSIVDTYNPSIREAVKRAIDQVDPDAIVVSTLDVVEYMLNLSNKPSILIDHNCEFAVLKRNSEYISGGIKRWRHEVGWKKFARWETTVCSKFSAVVVVSEEDKQQLLGFAPHLSNINVIPNGVDVDHFNPTDWSPEMDKLVYHGALTYGANLDGVIYYTSSIYPLLRSNYPDIKLRVTGRTDGVDLRVVEDWSGIELTGYVEDIREVLYKSAACVIPLRQGGGMRHKIPEAMAAGVPVVSTSMGAEGLDCIHGEHLLIADTPHEFAAAVGQLLTNGDLTHYLRENARKLMVECYSWAAIGESFVNLVEDTVKRN
jgi:glycosyltransferase involved in cell wall biosynthesis